MAILDIYDKNPHKVKLNSEASVVGDRTSVGGRVTDTRTMVAVSVTPRSSHLPNTGGV